MNQTKLLQLIESLLGSGKKQSKGEYIFYCPECQHRKRKLIVKLDPSYKTFGQFHCWVCQDYNGTKGKNLWSLFKKFKASPVQLERLGEILGNRYNITEKKEEQQKTLSLPKEYNSIWGYKGNKNDLAFRRAIAYLKRRGLVWGDIIKYQIGFCSSGEFEDRIIIPSFDENNQLNFFTARSYYKDSPLKYKNPKTSKDIIGFENMLNWKMPVILCEGVFDAISIRRNVIPLFGKTIMDNLKNKIFINRPPKIYISLDNDAKKNIFVVADLFLKEGLETYIVELDKKDPADIGFERMVNTIKNKSIKVDFSYLMKYKVGIS